MELTEQYVNQCMEDFSDSCRDFLRTSLEEMYRNYESFVAERMLSARRRYRELIETMVQDSKPEESLDSLLSDPKEARRVRRTGDSELEFKEEATSEDEDREDQLRMLSVYSSRRHLDDSSTFLSEAVAAHHADLGLGDSCSVASSGVNGHRRTLVSGDDLEASSDPPVGSRVSQCRGAPLCDSDECDLDASKDEEEDVKPAVIDGIYFKVEAMESSAEADVEAEVEEDVAEVYPRGLPASGAVTTTAGPFAGLLAEQTSPGAKFHRLLAPSCSYGLEEAADPSTAIIVELNDSPAAPPEVVNNLNIGANSAEIASARRQHLCKVCGRGFARAFDLRRHHRTHTGERPYVCDVCGRAFTQSFPLKVHKRKHTEHAPQQLHICGVCQRQCRTEADLVAHMNTHALTTGPEEPLATEEVEVVTGPQLVLEGDVVVTGLKKEEVP